MERPPRRMPSMKKICQHWQIPEGYCFRCGQPARCERAHLIDRCRDGLDDVQNVVPLCFPCHSEMPSFGPGDERAVSAWMSEDYWPFRAPEAFRRFHPQLYGMCQWLEAHEVAPNLRVLSCMFEALRRVATEDFPMLTPGESALTEAA